VGGGSNILCDVIYKRPIRSVIRGRFRGVLIKRPGEDMDDKSPPPLIKKFFNLLMFIREKNSKKNSDYVPDKGHSNMMSNIYREGSRVL